MHGKQSEPFHIVPSNGIWNTSLRWRASGKHYSIPLREGACSVGEKKQSNMQVFPTSKNRDISPLKEYNIRPTPRPTCAIRHGFFLFLCFFFPLAAVLVSVPCLGMNPNRYLENGWWPTGHRHPKFLKSQRALARVPTPSRPLGLTLCVSRHAQRRTTQDLYFVTLTSWFYKAGGGIGEETYIGTGSIQ